MNDENLYGSAENVSAPVLDDIEYAAPSAKKDGPQGVAAPVLDDMDYAVPSAKKDGPQGVAAPVLDDMDTYVPSGEKKGAPANVTAPVLDDNNYSTSSYSAHMSEEEEIVAGLTPEQRAMYDKLPPEKQQQIIEMRKAQLAQLRSEEAPVTAPVLDDADSYVPPKKEEKKPEATITAPVLDDADSYVPPKKEEKKPEAPITAPVLDDEPAPTKYVPRYVDEDLEKVKQEAKKKAVSSQLTSNQKDEKESLRMMLELKAERQAEAAAKGFKLTILIGIIGVVASVLFYLAYSCSFFGMEYTDSGNKFYGMIQDYSMYIAIVGAILSLSLMTGIGGLKSLCSFFYLVFSGVQLLGVFSIMPQISGGGAVKWILCAGALIGSVVVLIAPSASECIGLYYKKPQKQYDH